jgi:ribosomal-protein-alanine N-acetyltransferase
VCGGGESKNAMTTLTTKRLILRQWKSDDFPPFAQLNADLQVMQHFPAPLSAGESNILAEKIRSRIEKNGWGFWALETKADKSFIGFTGLNQPDANLPPSPCVEIGWRLATPFWGQGFATEAGMECLRFAFQNLNLKEIVSFTSMSNKRSQAVMIRLGMRNTQQNFFHPKLERTSPLCEHVLFSVTQQIFERQYDQFRKK